MLRQKIINKVSSNADIIGINPSRCLRMRYNKNRCNRCMESCPKSAIKIDEAFEINRNECSECMLCVSFCPSDAFKINRLDFLSIIAKLGKIESSVLGCNVKSNLSAHEKTPCLGFLTEEHFIFLLSLLKGPLQINLTECVNCKNGFIRNVLKERLQRVRIKSSMRIHEKIRLVEDKGDLDYQKTNYDRRSFFKTFKSQVFHGTIELFENPDINKSKHVYADKMVPLKKRFLNRALSVLPEEVKREILKNYYYSLIVDENCKQCLSCVGICPAGALKIHRDESTEGLLFNSSICNGCGLCESFCMNHAIHLELGFQGENPFEFVSTKGNYHYS